MNMLRTWWMIAWLIDFLCFIPLSAIFQLYHGKFYHLWLRVECTLFCYLQNRVRTYTILVIGLYELLGNPTTYLTEPPRPSLWMKVIPETWTKEDSLIFFYYCNNQLYIFTFFSVVSCDTNIPNAILSDRCIGHATGKCNFTCANGYEKAIDILECKSSGSWDHPINTVCQSKNIIYMKKAQKNPSIYTISNWRVSISKICHKSPNNAVTHECAQSMSELQRFLVMSDIFLIVKLIS